MCKSLLNFMLTISITLQALHQTNTTNMHCGEYTLFCLKTIYEITHCKCNISNNQLTQKCIPSSSVIIIIIGSILDNITDICELLDQGFIAVGSSCVWNIALSYIITSQTIFVIIFAKPVAFVLNSQKFLSIFIICMTCTKLVVYRSSLFNRVLIKGQEPRQDRSLPRDLQPGAHIQQIAGGEGGSGRLGTDFLGQN